MTSPTTNYSKLSKAQAAEIVLQRRKARQSFTDYCEYIEPDEPPAAHHRKLCEKLQDIEDGKLNNLMVFMPPGSAKSTYGSVRFPTHYLGRFPNKDLIQASNTAELAARFGRKARNIVDSKRYKTLFDVTLAKDSQAKNQWEVIGAEAEGDDSADTGEYYAIGVDGAVTGRRADGGLIDDPVKSKEDADSERIRDKTWDWYLTDFTTRIKPGGWQVIIQTRWHEDDLSGRILPKDWDGKSGYVTGHDGAQWYVLCIPAEAREGDVLGRTPGDMLWPEWFAGDFWERTKQRMPARDWNALYQQTPTPDEGMYFTRESFLRFDMGQQPTNLHHYITSDFAVTAKAEADWTVFGDWGIDERGEWWLLDVYKGQVAADVWVDVLLKWFKTKKPLRFFGESGQIRRSVEPFLKLQLRGKHNPISEKHSWITRTHDKVASAASFRGMVEMGMIHIPLTDWGEEVVTELLKFPAGEHDDQVDMCTLLGLAVTQGVAATKPEVEEIIEKDAYGLEGDSDDDWMLA